MFQGQQIADLVEILDRRNVKLFHSCQYIDLLSYLELGGIPSRHKLESEGKKFTQFISDDRDHENQVWDKVFLNLHDFGEIFNNRKGVPTVYGPIHFVFYPKALLEARDVALTLRSAGSPGFNRERESLDRLEDVDRLFYEGASLKSRKKLCEEFNKEYVSYPEINITHFAGLLSFDAVIEVIVDPLMISGKSLRDHIQSIKRDKYYGKKVNERKYNNDTSLIFTDIGRSLLTAAITLEDLVLDKNVDAVTHNWATCLKENNKKDMEKQWSQYVRYLREGTLLPILDQLEREKNLKFNSQKWELFKCITCGKPIMGFYRERHELDMHSGQSIVWKSLYCEVNKN